MTRSEARLLARHADTSPLTRKLHFRLALKRGGLHFYEYAEFHDVEVKGIDLVGAHVIEFSQGEVSLFVAADVTVAATAHFTDYSYATYDKEDDVYYGERAMQVPIEDEVRVSGSLTYRVESFPPSQWQDIILEEATVEPNPIDVDLETLLSPEMYH